MTIADFPATEKGIFTEELLICTAYDFAFEVLICATFEAGSHNTIAHPENLECQSRQIYVAEL